MTAGLQSAPSPDLSIQAEALRAAFPTHKFVVLNGRDIEVTRRRSLAYGRTVWTNGRLLWWYYDGTGQSRPAADPQGAARIRTTLARNTTGPQSPGVT